MFAAAIGASLLCGFHMFAHDFSPLALGLFLCIGRMSERLSRSGRIAMKLLIGIFWMPPLYLLAVATHTMFLLAPLLLAFVVGTLMLATCNSREALREGSTPC